MKRLIPLAIPFTLASVLAACAQESGPVAATEPLGPTPAPAVDEAPATTASATGTVEAVDAAAGKITIAHDPVASLDWPAMTMRFKATPEQIASVQPGQAVRFEFEARGMDGTITAIEPAD